MATQIYGKDHPMMDPLADASRSTQNQGNAQPVGPRGGAIRGFFFAMVFNVLLVLAALSAWELWRVIVR